jgi:hypothetical protein
MADVTALERAGDEAKRLALAAKHVDLVGTRAGRDLRRHGVGDRLGLALAQHLVDDQSRRGEAVAPDEGRRVVAAARRRTRRSVDAWQGRHLAATDGADFGRVPAKTREQRAGGGEHAVDRLDHRRRVAARVVAGEDAAAEPFAHEPCRRLEHTRLGAAEAVDALLRVADDEDARRSLSARAATRA